jgi:hypothetical protein
MIVIGQHKFLLPISSTLSRVNPLSVPIGVSLPYQA